VHWRSGEKRGLDYFDLKGAIGSLKIPTSFRRNPRPDFLLAVDIWSGDQQVGFAAQVPSERISTVGPTGSVLFAELNIDLIFHAETALSFRELDRFPLVMRDIAMIVPEKLSHAEIMAAIEEAREPLLATIELFDLFSGKEAASLGAGKKSLAYTLTYRDKTRTLTNDEISVVHAKIRERLQRELGVELRE
jgi:phenylalanyl-tRNA synthetase beta chain